MERDAANGCEFSKSTRCVEQGMNAVDRLIGRQIPGYVKFSQSARLPITAHMSACTEPAHHSPRFTALARPVGKSTTPDKHHGLKMIRQRRPDISMPGAQR